MKITNVLGLPEALVRAVERHEHVGADYSATQLQKSPRALWLQRRHDSEIESDVSEMVWALMGTAIHHIIESGEGKNEFSETYLEEIIDGVKLSGTADLYDSVEKKISDWKTTSVWSVIYGSSMLDWARQLNIYAYLMRHAGFEVRDLEIVAIMRDWQRSKAKYDPNYPQHQVARIPIELWHDDDIAFYIADAIATHEKYKDVPDNELPFCSDEYRWKDPEKYAVMKRGAKRAVNAQHLTYESALKHAQELGPNHYVETRRSEARRCEYCNASPFCNQYKGEQDGAN